jgi:hypothetical protein
MRSRRIYSYGLIAAGMVLLSTLLSPNFAAGEPEEQIGTTVSYAPEPGWTADKSSKTSHTVVFVAVGGVVVLLAACAVFFLLKKRGKTPSALPKQPAVQQAVPPPAKSVPQKSAGIPPSPKPAEKVIRPPPQPAAPSKPVVSPAAQPVPIVEPPRVSVPSPALPVSKQSAPADEAPKASHPSAESAPSPDEEDILFRHFDLLKKLKGKENV